MEDKMVKKITLDKGWILDFGPDADVHPEVAPQTTAPPVLVVIPTEVAADLGRMRNACECGGYRYFTTKAGRQAIRVLSGDGWKLNRFTGAGSRDWDDWSSRRRVDGAYSVANATSRGGGCWEELEIYRDSDRTAEQAAYADELAPALEGGE
jgi:hypothetical protein